MGDSPLSPQHEPEPVSDPGARPRNSWIAPGSSHVVDAPAPQEEPTGDEPTRGRRMLSRIPGLSRLSEQSGWAEGDAPTTEDPGWVFHEAGDPGGFEGWLYHYADGTMVDADGVEYAFPAEPEAAQPEAARPEAARPEAARPEAAETGAAETGAVQEPEAEPDPEPEPHLSVVESPPEAEPEEEAQVEAEAEPEPVAAAAPPAAEAAPEAAPERPADIPGFVEYSPTHVRGYLLGAVFVVASVAAVLTLFVAISEGSSPALVIAGGCMVLALVAWWALLGWKPTVVSIHEGVLEISRGGRTERFELADPATVVEFGGRPGSPTWAATVRAGNGPRTVLRSSQVKPRQFERIVRHYRARADSPASAPSDEATTD